MDLKKNVGRVFQQAVSGSAELAASQTKQWQTSQDLATKLEVSLGSLRDTEIRDLLGAFGNMHSELVSGAISTFSQHALIDVAHVKRAGVSDVPKAEFT